jgi:putative flippase GtrA
VSVSDWLASFARFAAAGAVGFAVDAGVLSLLVQAASMEPLHARLISMALAISVTWLVNRHYAFRERRWLPSHLDYAGYFAIQTLGVMINYGIFAVCLRNWPALAAAPVVPAAAGSASAMLFNFVTARHTLYSAGAGR